MARRLLDWTVLTKKRRTSVPFDDPEGARRKDMDVRIVTLAKRPHLGAEQLHSEAGEIVNT